MTPKHLEITVNKDGDKIILIDSLDKFIEMGVWGMEDKPGLIKFMRGAKYTVFNDVMNELLKHTSNETGIPMPPVTKQVLGSEL